MKDYWLVADIGGTNARFAFVNKDGMVGLTYFSCEDYEGIVPATEAYMKKMGIIAQKGIFAVAAPIYGSEVRFTSNKWSFNTEDTKSKLGLLRLKIMNDFEAVARAIPIIPQSLLTPIIDVPAQEFSSKVVIGPGTGLGVASVIWSEGKYIPVPGEGGHVTMPAKTQREFDVFQELLKEYSHVSAERVCSGKGLENLYKAICKIDGKESLPQLKAADISKNAINGSCEVCKESLDMMLRFLGRVAGDCALTINARGGVYIAGGIPTKLGDYFYQSDFAKEFQSKGRFKDFMSEIPVYMINHDAIGLLGLEHAAKLEL